ncbi:MAG: HDIG domain-containing protein [Candidatus Heimdallarchaeota archaeon]|nr:MAG: HDIG domain-containing protein [Candidatus Heimdallarchaeota archaeon]
MVTFPDYIESIQLLLRYSTPLNVISHSIYTAQTAMKVAAKFKEKKIVVDCDLILAGALLHDIGRCKSHNIKHGLIGSKLLQNEGLPKELCRIAEIHLFAGITRHEAPDLGLPFRDFLPVTLEEKIITYADNISKKDRLLSVDEVIERYGKYLPQSHPILNRVRLLHTEIEAYLA